MAFLLEPNLKEGRGGLRDVHSLSWAVAAQPDLVGTALLDGDQDELHRCYEALLGVRVELHRLAGRPDRAADARPTRTPSPSAARRARRRRADGHRRRGGADDLVDQRRGVVPGPQAGRGRPGVDARTRRWPPAWPSSTARCTWPTAPTRPTTPRCCCGWPPRRPATTRSSTASRSTAWPPRPPSGPTPWPAGAADDLVALLLEGHDAIAALEALDQRDLFTRRPPRMGAEPGPPAAQRLPPLHGRPAPVGGGGQRRRDRRRRGPARPAGARCPAARHRQGLPGRPHRCRRRPGARASGRAWATTPTTPTCSSRWCATTCCCPRWPRGATCPTTPPSQAVADAVEDPLTLELLAALDRGRLEGHRHLGVERPGRPTWSAELVDKVDKVLGGHDAAAVAGSWRLFPSEEVLALMAAGRRRGARRATVRSPWWPATGPGLFSRVAGVLSLHGLDVLGAQAHSDDPASGGPPMAANEFRWRPCKHGPVVWAPVERGPAPRPRRPARHRGPPRRTGPHLPPAQGPVGHAGPDVRARRQRRRRRTPPWSRCGRPTPSGCCTGSPRRWPRSGLDIRHAKVATLGHEVVDTFYVRHLGRQGDRSVPPARGRAGAAPRRRVKPRSPTVGSAAHTESVATRRSGSTDGRGAAGGVRAWRPPPSRRATRPTADGAAGGLRGRRVTWLPDAALVPRRPPRAARSALLDDLDGNALVPAVVEAPDGSTTGTLLRLRADGALDPGFGAGGQVRLPGRADGGGAAARRPVPGGHRRGAGCASRAGGATDPSFTAPLPVSPVYGLVALPDGRTLVVGASALATVDVEGRVDASFAATDALASVGVGEVASVGVAARRSRPRRHAHGGRRQRPVPRGRPRRSGPARRGLRRGRRGRARGRRRADGGVRGRGRVRWFGGRDLVRRRWSGVRPVGARPDGRAGLGAHRPAARRGRRRPPGVRRRRAPAGGQRRRGRRVRQRPPPHRSTAPPTPSFGAGRRRLARRRPTPSSIRSCRSRRRRRARGRRRVRHRRQRPHRRVAHALDAARRHGAASRRSGHRPLRAPGAPRVCSTPAPGSAHPPPGRAPAARSPCRSAATAGIPVDARRGRR